MGGTAGYDGGPIVEQSIKLGMPLIFVSMNYRITGMVPRSLYLDHGMLISFLSSFRLPARQRGQERGYWQPRFARSKASASMGEQIH